MEGWGRGTKVKCGGVGGGKGEEKGRNKGYIEIS